MPIPLWIPTAIQGAKALYTLFNKPKNQDPGMLIDPINRMISNQESDIQRKTLLNTLTSSAKSMGSRMYQQSQHGLDILKSKGELSEGQYAQGLLQSGSQIQSEVGQQQESALLQQEQRNIQAQDRIDQARMKIAEIKQQYKQANQGMQQQWRNELVGGVLDTATAGLSAAMESAEMADVKSAVQKYMDSSGFADITDLIKSPTGLNGLLATLMTARVLGGK
jgi:predicted phage tail protein